MSDMQMFHPDKVITVDFETFFSKKEKVGFSHQNTEEYIRHPRWLTHGVGVKKGFNQTRWIYGAKNVKAFFDKVDFSGHVMLAHNAKFDGLVLSHHYNTRPMGWVCTRSLAYMLYGNSLRSASLKALTELLLPGEIKDQTALFSVEGKRRLSKEEAHELGVYCIGDCDKTHMLYNIFYTSMQRRAAA